MEIRKRVNVFISYSHIDIANYEIFKDHLKRTLKSLPLFDYEIWDDHEICLGSHWEIEIEENLNKSDLALLLVSDGFFASDFIRAKEFGKLIMQFSKTLIIPILFAPCRFNQWDELSKRQFFMPSGEKYGNKTLTDFTFADVIKRADSDGSLIPTPHLNRYINDLCDSINKGYLKFIKNKKISNQVEVGHIEINDIPPYDINKCVDRIELISEIHKLLKTYPEPLLLNGVGGIGKTTIALKYLHHPKYGTRYSHVAWVTVTNSLIGDLMTRLSNRITGFFYEPEL